MGMASSMNEEKKNANRILVANPEGKRPLGRARHGWVDNTCIKMDLKEIGRGGMNWINLAPDKDQWRGLLNTIINHRVP
jgi:hypothetical protein